jgi:putative effector of murein hydrolase
VGVAEVEAGHAGLADGVGDGVGGREAVTFTFVAATGVAVTVVAVAFLTIVPLDLDLDTEAASAIGAGFLSAALAAATFAACRGVLADGAEVITAHRARG